jgi:hypothetical protein
VIRPRAERGDGFQAIFGRNEEELRYLTELHRKTEPFLELHSAKAEP